MTKKEIESLGWKYKGEVTHVGIVGEYFEIEGLTYGNQDTMFQLLWRAPDPYFFIYHGEERLYKGFITNKTFFKELMSNCIIHLKTLILFKNEEYKRGIQACIDMLEKQDCLYIAMQEEELFPEFPDSGEGHTLHDSSFEDKRLGFELGTYQIIKDLKKLLL